jgi:hypothetical protein
MGNGWQQRLMWPSRPRRAEGRTAVMLEIPMGQAHTHNVIPSDPYL